MFAWLFGRKPKIEVEIDRQFRTRVVGVTHRNSDGTKRQDHIKRLHVGEALTLEPEPDNPHDEHAVKVSSRHGEQLGYLESYLAMRLLSDLRADQAATARVTDLTGGTRDKPTRGVNIEITIFREPDADAP